MRQNVARKSKNTLAMKIEVIKSATTKWEDLPATDEGVIVIRRLKQIVTWDLPRDASHIETALELHNAKRILGTESFYDMIKSGVTGCTPSRVDNLLRIASNPVLGNLKHRTFIPVSEIALVCLADLTANHLEAGLRNGTVFPSMTEEAARDFVAKSATAYKSLCPTGSSKTQEMKRTFNLPDSILHRLKSWPYSERASASEGLHAVPEQVEAAAGELKPDSARNL